MQNSDTGLEKSIGDTAKAGLEATLEAGSKTVDTVEEKLRGARDKARERYHAMQEFACDCVTKHPGKSVASVAVVSLALGVLLGSRRSSH